MLEIPILTIITFVPLVGAGFIFFFVQESVVHGNMEKNAKSVAFFVTIFTFLLSLILPFRFDSSNPGYQFEERFEWISGSGIGYHLGVDGISLPFVLLTTFLLPVCIIASWNSIKSQIREYMICFLLLETLIIGVFVSLDFLVFYFFFEGSLIPMFFIIGIWGAENRVYAAFKFFLYTLLGSVLLLLALLYIYFHTGTTDIVEITAKSPALFTVEVQKILWLAFFASFAVKVPMWPVHTWLPDAHVQAPTAGSVILAGILLKLGGYGFLRFSLPMLPQASEHFSTLIFALSIVAVIYTSLVALMQTDMKKLIAYSSIAHMGYVTIGTFAFNQQAVEGAIFQMISHGLVSAALFLCVGVLYDRIHTKEISRFGGLTEKMPKYALMFMLFTMASVGLPATSGFVGEFLVLVGAFMANKLVALLACTGVILGAAYMLWLYKRVMFGELTRDDLKGIIDLEKREIIYFIPIALLVLLLGIYPNLVLYMMHSSVASLIQQLHIGGN